MKSFRKTTKSSFRFITIGLSFLLLSSFVLASNWQSISSFAQGFGVGFSAAPSANPSGGTQNTALNEKNLKDDNLTFGTCDTAGPVEIESSGGTTAPTAYP